MGAPKYKVRFIADAQVEHAPPPGESGYRVERIPAGTEMEVNEASLRFWRARNKVVVIEKPPGRRESSGRRPPRDAEPPEANPFDIAGPVVLTEEKPARVTKSSLRKAAQEALKAHGKELVPYLECILAEAAVETLEGLLEDSRTVLEAALEDLRGSDTLSVNRQDLDDAFGEIINLLLPPSAKRRRTL